MKEEIFSDETHSFTFIFNANKWLIFFLLFALNALALFIYSKYLLTVDLYYQTYGERIALDRIDSFIEVNKQFSWAGYVLIPFVLLIKISFTAFCLNIGTLFANIKTGFRELWGIALVAEIIFVLANLIRSLWLGFISHVDNLEEAQYFYPLSLINFFTSETLSSWLTYPVITANIFEICYFLLLAVGLQLATDKSFAKSLGLVTLSYGTGLLIWAVFVVFLSINLS